VGGTNSGTNFVTAPQLWLSIPYETYYGYCSLPGTWLLGLKEQKCGTPTWERGCLHFANVGSHSVSKLNFGSRTATGCSAEDVMRGSG
jgi:hypothetical protein